MDDKNGGGNSFHPSYLGNHAGYLSCPFLTLHVCTQTKGYNILVHSHLVLGTLELSPPNIMLVI
jgi:hypothetical protein